MCIMWRVKYLHKSVFKVNQVPLSMGQERNEFSQVKSDPDQSNSPSMVLKSFNRLESDEVRQHSALSITSLASAA